MKQYRVQRKIHFFSASTGIDDAGNLVHVDLTPILKRVDSLPFNQSRYEIDADNNALCILFPYKNTYDAIQFCRIRRSGLPLLERHGNLSELRIDPDTGLLEPVHIVFFPKNIVGIEYNHYGPRLSRLGRHLHRITDGEVRNLTFHPQLREDALKQMERLHEIRIFDFAIGPSYLRQVKECYEDFGIALEAQASLGEDLERLSLVLKPSKSGRESTLRKLKGPIMSLLKMPGFQAHAERFQIRGLCLDTGRVETLDLLSDRLVSTKRIVKINKRSRALDPASAFDAIRDAYHDLQPLLERSVSIVM